MYLKVVFWEEDIGFVLDHFANKASKTERFSKEREALTKTYSRIINIYASTDEVGDIMPFEDFYESVKCGGFIDYDFVLSAFIDDLTEENGFANIQISEGEGRNG